MSIIKIRNFKHKSGLNRQRSMAYISCWTSFVRDRLGFILSQWSLTLRKRGPGPTKSDAMTRGETEETKKLTYAEKGLTWGKKTAKVYFWAWIFKVPVDRSWISSILWRKHLQLFFITFFYKRFCYEMGSQIIHIRESSFRENFEMKIWCVDTS